MTTVGPAELRRRRKRLLAEAEGFRAAAECLAADDVIDPPGYLLGIAHAKTEAAARIDELLEAP